MGQIKILNKGVLTSIQDLGRRGYQKYGVPVCGVMDEYSHRIANILVGNKMEEATLEVTLFGLKIEFIDKQMISITGGNLQPKINNKIVDMWQTLEVKKGDILSLSGLKSGMRSYIAFSGGFDIEKTMGSKSYYSRAGLGTKVENNQILNIKTNLTVKKMKLEKKYIPEFESKIECRVVLGPQDDYFSDQAIDIFFKSEYALQNDSDRMGFRLKGEPISHKKTADIISDGLSKGAIQIPGNGQPIIMMSDAQTTGGYTKIGYVIKEDLNKLSQLKPGGKIRFKKVMIEKAQKEYIKYINKYYEVINDLRTNRNVIEYKIMVNGKKYQVSVEVIED